MSEKDLLKNNKIYELIVQNTMKLQYDWKKVYLKILYNNYIVQITNK